MGHIEEMRSIRGDSILHITGYENFDWWFVRLFFLKSVFGIGKFLWEFFTFIYDLYETYYLGYDKTLSDDLNAMCKSLEKMKCQRPCREGWLFLHDFGVVPCFLKTTENKWVLLTPSLRVASESVSFYDPYSNNTIKIDAFLQKCFTKNTVVQRFEFKVMSMEEGFSGKIQYIHISVLDQHFFLVKAKQTLKNTGTGFNFLPRAAESVCEIALSFDLPIFTFDNFITLLDYPEFSEHMLALMNGTVKLKVFYDIMMVLYETTLKFYVSKEFVEFYDEKQRIHVKVDLSTFPTAQPVILQPGTKHPTPVADNLTFLFPADLLAYRIPLKERLLQPPSDIQQITPKKEV
jgi:hypothetical protein